MKSVMTYEKSKFEVKAYTMKELASFYQISVKSFRTWINPFKNEIGKKQGRYYNVNAYEFLWMSKKIKLTKKDVIQWLNEGIFKDVLDKVICHALRRLALRK